MIYYEDDEIIHTIDAVKKMAAIPDIKADYLQQHSKILIFNTGAKRILFERIRRGKLGH